MAVDVCSEISSPRISFSHDLKELDFVPVEQSRQSDLFLLNPTIDFDFCIKTEEISPADELFANGKILPVQIKNIAPPKVIYPISAHSNPENTLKKIEFQNDNTKKKRLIEFLSFDTDEEEDQKPITKPFWQFRRSSSVNCDNGRANGLLRSLNFLTRSNSTGSVPIPKQSGFPKVMQKQRSLKEEAINCGNSSGPSFNPYTKKPSLKNSTSSKSYGNGVRINPVLHIPPTYTVSFFGIGSLFCSKKSKKKRK
ncbi:hypothetical protein CDL12_20492 [Handroanthus impetiginosus]|uniref:Uncharacterized protein n=1 Tax=Handroanthus impetiginosus TaxID=429701 RepID=A0A2G9GNT0_9LAMI|nr:hypothetical protein CDL12_20492 [Handroanthus impetiginosus]